MGPLRALQHQVGGAHYDEQIGDGEMRETEKQNGPCTVGRGRREKMKTVQSRLMLEACLPPEAKVKAVRSKLRGVVCLPPGAMVMSGPDYCQVPCLGV